MQWDAGITLYRLNLREKCNLFIPSMFLKCVWKYFCLRGSFSQTTVQSRLEWRTAGVQRCTLGQVDTGQPCGQTNGRKLIRPNLETLDSAISWSFILQSLYKPRVLATRYGPTDEKVFFFHPVLMKKGFISCKISAGFRFKLSPKRIRNLKLAVKTNCPCNYTSLWNGKRLLVAFFNAGKFT